MAMIDHIRRPRSTWALAVRFALAITLVAALRPSIATANTFGAIVCDTSLASQCVADNGVHQWYTIQVASSIYNTMNWVDSNVFDPVAGVTMLENGFEVADLHIYDGTYGTNGFRAWITCNLGAEYGGSGANRWCKAQKISFNNGSYPGEYNLAAKRRYVSCHEVGHSLGLHHSGDPDSVSCMRDLALGSSTSAYEGRTNLNPHDHNHLEDQY
jgi:hypothetical protein